jgi:hypothetical protein
MKRLAIVDVADRCSTFLEPPQHSEVGERNLWTRLLETRRAEARLAEALPDAD